MEATPSFIFITCQIGAEGAVKAELARDYPGFRFAYSRPGFLTFKLPPDHSVSKEWKLQSVFARTAAISLGKVMGETLDQRAEAVWKLAGPMRFDQIHVSQRDRMRHVAAPLDSQTVQLLQPIPQPSPATEAETAIRRLRPAESQAPAGSTGGRPPQWVLDCVLVEPDEWWVGYHRLPRVPGCWPGGPFHADLPPDAVSRAYLKMEEALAWSQLPIEAGNLCVEIGSAPGGASQALLRHGLRVIGIDPADMDPRVLADPNFAHWKMRGQDVRRREFRKVRWLMADMNVAPQYTLDTVEAIVTHREIDVAGMLLTLKLLDWSLAAEVPAYLERVRSWGFVETVARQLHHNRREICVAALRDPKLRRKRPARRRSASVRKPGG